MNNSFSSGMSTSRVVGYGFHPTDEELVKNYLKPKILGDDSGDQMIAVVNICDFEPWHLPSQSKVNSNNRVWYFIWCRSSKSCKNHRPNRTTEAGFWKITGKPRRVKTKRVKKEIGTKNTLVFYKGHSKGVKTNWVMHEYQCLPDPNSPNLANIVLCKLKKKSDGKADNGALNHPVLSSKSDNHTPNMMTAYSACDLECQIPNESTPASASKIQEFGSVMASISGNHIPNMNMTTTRVYSACDNIITTGYSVCVESPHLEIQVPDEATSISTYGIGESRCPLAFDSDIHIPNMMTNEIPPISTSHVGELTCQPAHHSEDQNPDKRTGTPVSKEGERCSLTPLFSCFESPSPYMDTDSVTFDEDFGCLRASDLENNLAEAGILEISPAIEAELEAFFKLEEILNLPLQLPVPPMEDGPCSVSPAMLST